MRHISGGTVETDEILRILDANANRAREGIRTAEDFLRFTLEQTVWTRRLRELRRAVTERLWRLFPARELTAARNVEGDVGREDGEQPRGGEGTAAALAVAVRGLKRAQEALRVLEEYTRGRASGAEEFARIRYELYRAEEFLSCGWETARRLQGARLYVLLTESLCRRDFWETARLVLRGGAGAVQLREKELGGAELLARAVRLRDLCAEQGAVFIVNDRPDVALAAGADGVHLGQGDLPPAAVRRWAGSRLALGRSTHSLAEARRAVEEGAHYLAVGAMYATASKADYSLVGPGLAREVEAQGWGLPVFAIGGVTRERLGELRAAGVRRVAVSGAVLGAPDPERAARELLEGW